jgi:arsenate reductase
MSEALFEKAAGGRHSARSAGTNPAKALHPEVVAAMAEVGFDLGSSRPARLTDELASWADVVVTMGCGDQCPFIPGKRYIDWTLPDPKGLSLGAVREIREQIANLVVELVQDLDQRRP